MTGTCDFGVFQINLTEWMNDTANGDALFQEFVNAADDFLRVCLGNKNVEMQCWNSNDSISLLTFTLIQTPDISQPSADVQVLTFSGKWPDDINGSHVHFGIHAKVSTTLLREGQVVDDPADVRFVTNRISTNYTIVGIDGETIHYIGKSKQKCSCKCSTRKSTKKKSSQKSSSSKSCRHKSSDDRNSDRSSSHGKKHRCRSCQKYH